MPKAAHTSLPWKVGGDIGMGLSIVTAVKQCPSLIALSCLGAAATTEERAANAELIVLAVNNFGALLEACRLAAEQLDVAQSIVDDDYNCKTFREVRELCLSILKRVSAKPTVVPTVNEAALHALEMMLEKFEYDVLEGEAGWDAVTAARAAVAQAKAAR
jgi:hypothetical protein